VYVLPVPNGPREKSEGIKSKLTERNTVCNSSMHAVNCNYVIQKIKPKSTTNPLTEHSILSNQHQLLVMKKFKRQFYIRSLLLKLPTKEHTTTVVYLLFIHLWHESNSDNQQ
jgi:hypothetical protein